MSAQCPLGHPPGQSADTAQDPDRTTFGQCMDALRDTPRTPHVRRCAGAPPVPSRPYPSLTGQRTAGVGLPPSFGASFRTALTSEVYGVLDRGVASLGTTRNGHPWPRPRKYDIEQLVERYDEETCRQAAAEAREIVQSEDFAPNVTSLFAKKCADIAAEQEAERLSRREEIRRALA